jgi:hypothetical protein
LIALAEPAAAQISSARDTAVRDLRNVFAPGFMLQDRNADDVIDFVNAKIVLPAGAAEAELVAAANVAARLGYETSATNLDLAAFDNQRDATFDTPVVLIGSRNALLSRAGLASRATSLAPGEGAVVYIAGNETFRRGGVAIIAGDASGLVAAANYFSSRYPSVWAVRGSTYGDLAERLTRFLQQRNVTATSVNVEHIVIDAARRGVARAQVRVRVSDSTMVARAMAALDVPDSAARDSTTGTGRGRGGGAGGARDSSDATNAPQGQGGGRGRLRRADLDVTDLHRIDVVITGGSAERIVRLLPARPWQTRASAEWAPRESPDFALSDLYTIRGLYRDTNQDLMPDRMEAHLSVHGGESPEGLVTLAERIGLETAGIRLPVADVGGQADYPQDAGFPIVFGVGHYQTDRLIKSGKLAGNVNRAGEGFLQFAKGAFGGRNGLVIGAPDKPGLDAITDYAAKRVPYLWEYGKGKTQLSDVEEEVRRFTQAKDAAGQTALALHKIETWLTRLRGKAIDSLGVELATKERYEGIDRHVENLLRERFPSAKRSVKSFKTGFGVNKQIFAQDFDVPWEVDAFWKAFRADALPKLSPGSKGRIEVRVSESPQMRGRIAQDIRRALATKGLAPNAYEVVVLSAYKQGYSWLNDEILPQLKDRLVGRIEITYRSLKDSKEVRWQVVESDTRWLQELYPIDAVMAKELGIADSLISFTATQDQGPVYRVRVLGRDGREMLTSSFSPKYVIRPMFDLVPDYEHVRVTTGWLTVVANNATVVDQRIKTDAESFWDVLQSDTYKRIADYVMDVQHGRPSSGNAPYFDELRVEMTMSEPTTGSASTRR